MKIVEIIQRPENKKLREILYIIGIGSAVTVLLQLVLSTALADGVYKIAKLKHEQKELLIDSQIMQDEIAQLSSLYSVDSKARNMGMVPAEKWKFIKLRE